MPTPDVDLDEQRRLVDAFFAASREGDLDGLVAVLDPERGAADRRRAGPSAATSLVRGATAVAERAMTFRNGARWTRPVIVNGEAGVVIAPEGPSRRRDGVHRQGRPHRRHRPVSPTPIASPSSTSAPDQRQGWRARRQ